MYIRNDGKGVSNNNQKVCTTYLLSSVTHRKED